jgi:hypothetical protein
VVECHVSFRIGFAITHHALRRIKQTPNRRYKVSFDGARPRDFSYDQAFLFYFQAFLNLKEFKPSFTPFLNRPIGPQLFIHPFPPLPECEEEMTNIWKAYLTPTLLSCRFGTTSTDFGLVGYFPNLVSRQFGLTQILAKSIYLHEKDICLGYYGMTEPHFRDFLKKFQGNQYDFIPFKFEFSYATTKEFSQWWELQYCGHVVSESLLLEAVKNGFEESILNKIKSKLNIRGNFLPSLYYFILPSKVINNLYISFLGSKSKVASNTSNQPPALKVKAEPGVSFSLFVSFFLYICFLQRITISMSLF